MPRPRRVAFSRMITTFFRPVGHRGTYFVWENRGTPVVFSDNIVQILIVVVYVCLLLFFLSRILRPQPTMNSAGSGSGGRMSESQPGCPSAYFRFMF